MKDVEKKEPVTIVALDNYSWKLLLQNKFYAFPKGSRKIGSYFAFYQGRPISAITHYAKVDSLEEGGREDVGIRYWLNCMPNATPPFQIVRFKEIKKIRSPITKDDSFGQSHHIQGKAYTDLKELLSAKNIPDIFKIKKR